MHCVDQDAVDIVQQVENVPTDVRFLSMHVQACQIIKLLIAKIEDPNSFDYKKVNMRVTLCALCARLFMKVVMEFAESVCRIMEFLAQSDPALKYIALTLEFVVEVAQTLLLLPVYCLSYYFSNVSLIFVCVAG